MISSTVDVLCRLFVTPSPCASPLADHRRPRCRRSDAVLPTKRVSLSAWEWVKEVAPTSRTEGPSLPSTPDHSALLAPASGQPTRGRCLRPPKSAPAPYSRHLGRHLEDPRPAPLRELAAAAMPL